MSTSSTSINRKLDFNSLSYFTVWNKATMEIEGTDYLLEGAFDAIIEFNERDQCDDWVFFDSKGEIPIDILDPIIETANQREIEMPVRFRIIQGGKV